MSSLLQACWAAAVTLALYAFYCFWEASRADLVAGFRHLATRQSMPPGAGYRMRGWLAGGTALLLALGCLLSVL